MPDKVRRTVNIVFIEEVAGLSYVKHDGVVDLGIGNGFYWVELESGAHFRYAVGTIARVHEYTEKRSSS